jgi:hypothetical protein
LERNLYDLEKILDLGGFGKEFEGFGKDFRLGEGLDKHLKDLERIFDLGRIWKGI